MKEQTKTIYILQCYDTGVLELFLIGKPIETKEEALQRMTEDIREQTREECLEEVMSDQVCSDSAWISSEQSEHGEMIEYRISTIMIDM